MSPKKTKSDPNKSRRLLRSEAKQNVGEFY